MDLIFVTYNSEKWIHLCFDSLLESNYTFEKLNIYVIDNHSSDKTIQYLEEYRSKFSCCKSYHLILKDQNYGFGKANNIAANYGNSEIIVFINIDIEFYPDTLQMLEREINHSSSDIGIWEIRQFPYEHPKKYNVVTMETSWASGAAFAIRRSIYKLVGGFDEIFFMYAEDVDISWRVRSMGYKIKYIPKSTVKHYCYSKPYEIKPLQYCNSIINDLYLRYRYGNTIQKLKGHCRIISRLLHDELYKGAKKDLLIKYMEYFHNIKLCNKKTINSKKIAKFIGFEYEYSRLGAFYFHNRLTVMPPIAIIIKNNFPKDIDILLSCLKNQTYPSVKWYCLDQPIKVKSMDIISLNPRTLLSAINVLYFSLVDENFLYYADHFETLVTFIENTNYLGVRSCCKGAIQPQTLSGIVFNSTIFQTYKNGISFSDIYSRKNMQNISRYIKDIDTETKEIWRH